MTEEDRKILERCKREDILDLREFERKGETKEAEAVRRHLKENHAIDL